MQEGIYYTLYLNIAVKDNITEAKLKIQKLIVDGKIELASSYFSLYECNNDKNWVKAEYVTDFISSNTSVFIGNEYLDNIQKDIGPLLCANIKYYDASHILSAVRAQADYFITVDDKLRNRYKDMIKNKSYDDGGLRMIKPDEFPFASINEVMM